MTTNVTRASFNLSERTCASSVGGPGLNLGEQIAGKSRLGTACSPNQFPTISERKKGLKNDLGTLGQADQGRVLLFLP